jgi:predicted RND superfamily exporter protein
MSILFEYCFRNIWLYCDIKSIINSSICCSDVRLLLNDETLWKTLTLRDHEHFEYKDDITWQELYKKLYKNNIFIQTRSGIFTISNELYGTKNNIIPANQALEVLNLFNNFVDKKREEEKLGEIKENKIYSIVKNIKKGDIVIFECFRQRKYVRNKYIEKDDVRFIYNGHSFEFIISMQCYTKYNMLPIYKAITDRPINYWDNYIIEEYNIDFDNIYIDEIERNAKTYYTDRGEQVIRSSFIHNYSKYYIIIELDACNVEIEDIDFTGTFVDVTYTSNPVIMNRNDKLIHKNRTIFTIIDQDYIVWKEGAFDNY